MESKTLNVRPFPVHPLRLTSRKTPGFNPRALVGSSEPGGSSTTQDHVHAGDPRDQCCYGGEVFLDAIKAMLSRMLLLLHAFLLAWRLVALMGPAFWGLLSISLLLIIETLVVLLIRKGKDWKWFSPCVFIYLMCVLPGIWIMHLQNVIPLGNEIIAVVNKTQDHQSNSLVSQFGISEETWNMLLEQSMLLLIIISRWLMPKGDMSRDQLSALLLGYVGTASDSVDFAALLADHAQFDVSFMCVILAFYSFSLFQFVFIKTVVDEDDASDIAEDDDAYDIKTDDVEIKTKTVTNPKQLIINQGKDKNKKSGSQDGEEKSGSRSMWRVFIRRVLKTEVWAIFVTLFMQDGPFLLVRIVATTQYNLTGYTHYFFIAKNIILIALQLYRLCAIYRNYKQEEQQKTEERKKLWKQFYKNVTYMNAFSSNFENNKKKTLTLDSIDVMTGKSSTKSISELTRVSAS